MAGQYRAPPPVHSMIDPGGPQCSLSVSDIERLAKAGVAMAFNDIKHQVMPDPPPQHGKNLCDDSQWTKPLIDRFMIGRQMENHYVYTGSTLPFWLSAVPYQGKMFVTISNYGGPPTMIEDDLKMYPSDALLAKINMLIETTAGAREYVGATLKGGGIFLGGEQATQSAASYSDALKAGIDAMTGMASGRIK